ncbi:RNA polymerase II mediator complex subunit [Boothiomyces sp. JEL0866]|nr:RNA polymerase II mediator complex subunit [Boothiomyces sp. JEL0866]
MNQDLKSFQLQPPSNKWLYKTDTETIYADVYPQIQDQQEDILTKETIQKGYVSIPPLRHESHSAYDLIVDDLSKKLVRLSQLSKPLLKFHSPIEKNNFSIPDRRIMPDAKREQWLNDLKSQKDLKLMDRVPHGFKQEKLLETIVEREIPVYRALWFIKCVGYAENKRNNMEDYSNDWTKIVLLFLTKFNPQKMNYFVNLVKRMMDESLLVQFEFLKQLLILFQKRVELLPMVQILTPYYLKNRFLTKQLVLYLIHLNQFKVLDIIYHQNSDIFVLPKIYHKTRKLMDLSSIEKRANIFLVNHPTLHDPVSLESMLNSLYADEDLMQIDGHQKSSEKEGSITKKNMYELIKVIQEQNIKPELYALLDKPNEKIFYLFGLLDAFEILTLKEIVIKLIATGTLNDYINVLKQIPLFKRRKIDFLQFDDYSECRAFVFTYLDALTGELDVLEKIDLPPDINHYNTSMHFQTQQDLKHYEIQNDRQMQFIITYLEHFHNYIVLLEIVLTQLQSKQSLLLLKTLLKHDFEFGKKEILKIKKTHFSRKIICLLENKKFQEINIKNTKNVNVKMIDVRTYQKTVTYLKDYHSLENIKQIFQRVAELVTVEQDVKPYMRLVMDLNQNGYFEQCIYSNVFHNKSKNFQDLLLFMVMNGIVSLVKLLKNHVVPLFQNIKEGKQYDFDLFLHWTTFIETVFTDCEFEAILNLEMNNQEGYSIASSLIQTIYIVNTRDQKQLEGIIDKLSVGWFKRLVLKNPKLLVYKFLNLVKTDSPTTPYVFSFLIKIFNIEIEQLDELMESQRYWQVMTIFGYLAFQKKNSVDLEWDSKFKKAVKNCFRYSFNYEPLLTLTHFNYSEFAINYLTQMLNSIENLESLFGNDKRDYVPKLITVIETSKQFIFTDTKTDSHSSFIEIVYKALLDWRLEFIVRILCSFHKYVQNVELIKTLIQIQTEEPLQDMIFDLIFCLVDELPKNIEFNKWLMGQQLPKRLEILLPLQPKLKFKPWEMIEYTDSDETIVNDTPICLLQFGAKKVRPEKNSYERLYENGWRRKNTKTIEWKELDQSIIDEGLSRKRKDEESDRTTKKIKSKTVGIGRFRFSELKLCLNVYQQITASVLLGEAYSGLQTLTTALILQSSDFYPTIFKMSKNGIGYVVKSRAPGLANYPHARKAGGFVFVSGISSRNPDNSSWEGVIEHADGSFTLDIKQQTHAVIKK